MAQDDDTVALKVRVDDDTGPGLAKVRDSLTKGLTNQAKNVQKQVQRVTSTAGGSLAQYAKRINPQQQKQLGALDAAINDLIKSRVSWIEKQKYRAPTMGRRNPLEYARDVAVSSYESMRRPAQSAPRRGPAPPSYQPAQPSPSSPSVMDQAGDVLSAIQANPIMRALTFVAGRTVGAGMRASDAYQQFAMANRGALGVVSENDLFRANNLGSQFGYMPNESSAFALQAAQARGSEGAVEAAAQAMMMSRAGYGVDASSFIGMQGTLRRGGIDTADSSPQNRRLLNLYATAMTQGIDRSRMGEALPAFTGIMEQIQNNVAGDVSGGGIASLAALFGQSGMSGLQGARGMSVISQLNQGLMNPGGGDEGRALLYQAAGFGVPGSSRSLFDVQTQLEGGLSDTRNIGTLQRFIGQLGGADSEAAIRALSDVFGLSLTQSQAAARSLMSGGTPEEMERRLREIEEQAKSPELKAQEAMQEGIGSIAKLMSEQNALLISDGANIAKPMLVAQQRIYELERLLFPQMATALNLMATAAGGGKTLEELETERVSALVRRSGSAALPEVQRLEELHRAGAISTEQFNAALVPYQNAIVDRVEAQGRGGSVAQAVEFARRYQALSPNERVEDLLARRAADFAGVGRYGQSVPFAGINAGIGPDGVPSLNLVTVDDLRRQFMAEKARRDALESGNAAGSLPAQPPSAPTSTTKVGDAGVAKN